MKVTCSNPAAHLWERASRLWAILSKTTRQKSRSVNLTLPMKQKNISTHKLDLFENLLQYASSLEPRSGYVSLSAPLISLG